MARWRVGGGCGGALRRRSPAARQGGGSKLIVVSMSNLAYAPQTITAHIGDRVAWANNDIFLHSATTGDFDVVLKPGASGGVRLLKPGSINCICRYHPGMKGQIVVEK
jgi:plastocyanin